MFSFSLFSRPRQPPEPPAMPEGAVRNQLLPADMAAIRGARAFKRFNFFGFRFGPSNVRDIQLFSFAGGLGLHARARVGNRWVDVPQDILDKVAVRHIDLSVAATAALQGGLAAPSGELRLPGAAGLQRKNALRRRTVSAPARFLGTGVLGLGVARLEAELANKPRSPSAPLPSALLHKEVPSFWPVLAQAPLVAAQSALVEEADSPAVSPAPTPLFEGPASPPSSLASSVASLPAQNGLDASKDFAELDAGAQQQVLRAYAGYVQKHAQAGEFGTDTLAAVMATMLGRQVDIVTQLYFPKKDANGEVMHDEWDLPMVEDQYVLQQYNRGAGEEAPLRLILRGASPDAFGTTGTHFDALVGLGPKGAAVPLDGDALAAHIELVPGDGDCLYHALAAGLGNTTGPQLRAAMVDFLAKNPEAKISMADGGSQQVVDAVRMDLAQTF